MLSRVSSIPSWASGWRTWAPNEPPSRDDDDGENIHDDDDDDDVNADEGCCRHGDEGPLLFDCFRHGN